MTAHYVYQEPDKTRLWQGDILRKDESLLAHFDKYHPYYAKHSDYKYFMVLTQSCDLTRRGGNNPSSPYITLAAVRPIEQAIRREAAKSQLPWQREVGMIGGKTRDKLAMFLESLLDNNKEGYFYLHSDISVGIQQSCVAFLRLAVALKVEHYDLCLDAKIAELKEPFQAKLGYLIGHMYSRIGTTEWNDNYPDHKVAKEASQLLGKIFVTVDDQKIEEGLADLKKMGDLREQTSSDIKGYILKKKVLSRLQKFREHSLKLLTEDSNLIDQIFWQISNPLRNDSDLASGIDALLTEASVNDEDRPGLRDRLIANFIMQLQRYLSDENMPNKKKVLEKALNGVLQDPLIRKIM